MSITTPVCEEYNFLKRKNFKVCITKRFFEQKSLSTTTSTTCIQSTFTGYCAEEACSILMDLDMIRYTH